MKKLLVALVLALAFVSSAFAADKELRLYTWSEYIDPEIIPQFEKATGYKVRMDLYESMEEMMAKLQAGGVSQYDVVIPSDYMLPALFELGLLQKLDHAKLPNMKNLAAKFINPPYDKDNTYTVAYQWGTVGMMYNKDVIKTDEPSWGIMFDPAQQVGPFVLIDSVRECLGVAQSYMGMDVNTTNPEDLKKLADLMLETKKSKYFQGFDVGTGGRSKVAAGTAVAAAVYNGDAMRAVAENPNTAFANPKEGTVIWVDSMAIPAKAPNPEAAYAFINYILDAKVGAQLSNWTQYPTPNAASLPMINEADRNNPAIYPSQEYMDNKLHFIEDLGNNTRYYDELWTMIKTR